MKELIKVLCLTVAIAAIGCTEETKEDPRYDSGISRELAEWRKATISDLSYKLHFDLPAERSEAVDGSAEVIDIECEGIPMEEVDGYHIHGEATRPQGKKRSKSD